MSDHSDLSALIGDVLRAAREVHLTMPQTADAIATNIVAAGWRPPSTGAVIPSRTSDPATSRAAEPTPVKAGTQRAALLAAFASPGAERGLTDEEAADLADGVPYRSEFAKRCSELRAAELLEVVPGVTRSGVSGYQRLVSRITDQGRDTSARLT